MFNSSVTFKFDPGLLDSLIKKHIDKAMKQLAVQIANDAKLNHRYKSRSGKLRKSTTYWINQSEQKFAVYVSEQANYGQYVINGHGTWKADPFIEEAFKKNEGLIKDTYNNAVKSAVQEWNKLNRS